MKTRELDHTVRALTKGLSICIPSAGRATVAKQVTLRQMPPELREHVILVVPFAERDAYRVVAQELNCRFVFTPKPVRGIAKTRAWIFDRFEDKYIIMADDDMYFFKRPDITSTKLVKCMPSDVVQLFTEVRRWLSDGYSMVGVSARQGNNLVDEEYKTDTRAMNFYGFRRKRILKHVELGRVPVMEDFDITLQLLRKGFNNLVLYGYCWNQAGSGAVGGCSTYRTATLQAIAARKLQKLHPQYVTLVTKKSKSGWKGLATRLDVRVAWQRAAKHGAIDRAEW